MALFMGISTKYKISSVLRNAIELIYILIEEKFILTKRLKELLVSAIEHN